MNKRLFGTDGMRGRVNEYPMLPDMALRLGLAAGMYFRTGNRRHRVVIGKDTRLSGYIYENALTAGLCAAGMDVFLVGPLPTPAIAFLTANMRADFGIVISASHNPSQDNGIKFFDSQGFKLQDRVEDIITDMVLDPTWEWEYPAPDKVGRSKSTTRRAAISSPSRTAFLRALPWTACAWFWTAPTAPITRSRPWPSRNWGPMWW